VGISSLREIIGLFMETFFLFSKSMGTRPPEKKTFVTFLNCNFIHVYPVVLTYTAEFNNQFIGEGRAWPIGTICSATDRKRTIGGPTKHSQKYKHVNEYAHIIHHRHAPPPTGTGQQSLEGCIDESVPLDSE
jgi:hypothetical protein